MLCKCTSQKQEFSRKWVHSTCLWLLQCRLLFWLSFLTLPPVEEAHQSLCLFCHNQESFSHNITHTSDLSWCDGWYLVGFLWVNTWRPQMGSKKYFLFGYCNQPHYSVESCGCLILVLLSITHILPYLKSHRSLIWNYPTKCSKVNY